MGNGSSISSYDSRTLPDIQELPQLDSPQTQVSQEQIGSVPREEIRELVNARASLAPGGAEGVAAGAGAEIPEAVLLEVNAQSQALGELNLVAAGESDLDADMGLTTLFEAEDAPVSMDENGVSRQDAAVPETALAALTKAEDPAQNLTLAAVRENLRDLEALMAELDGPGKGEGAPSPLRLRLDASLTALRDLEASRAATEELRGQLAGLDALPPDQRLAAFDFETMRGRWNAMADTAQSTAALADPARRDAAEARLKGDRLSPDDLAGCREAMCDKLGGILYETAKEEAYAPILSQKSCAHIARIALESGLKPAEVLAAIGKSVQGMAVVSGGRDRDVLEYMLEGMLTAKSDLERAQYVDNLFVSSYPETIDEALAIKLALVPEESRGAITAYHSFVVSKQMLMVDIMRAVDPGNAGKYNAISVRGFAITPDLATRLAGKIDIKDFNYHLAHVALLQAEAYRNGYFDSPKDTAADKAAKASMADMKQWKTALQLDEYISETETLLHDPATRDATLGQINRAVDRFSKGFSGETQVDRAGRLVQKTASMSAGLFSGTRENQIYRNDPQVMARLALDRHIENLTGIMDPSNRLFTDEAMVINGEAIDAAILKNMQGANGVTGSALKDKALFGQLDAEISGVQSYQDAKLAELKGCRRPFLTHVRSMETLAAQTGEVVRLRAELTEKLEHSQEMGKVWNEVSWSWPHRRAGRTRACKIVVELAKNHANIDALNKMPQPLSAENQALRETLLKKEGDMLDSLRGVNLKTMNYAGGKSDPAPGLETVLRDMLPKAEAVLYFTTKEGEAQRKEMLEAAHQLRDSAKQINALLGTARKVYGQEGMTKLNEAIEAAVLKTFAESGASLEEFSVHDDATRAQINAQLAKWGVTPDKGFFSAYLATRLYSLTDDHGRLSMDTLRQIERTTEDSQLAGDAKSELIAAEFAKGGFDLFADVKVEETLAQHKEALMRQQGVHGLMQKASMPGGGFSYDLKEGVVLSAGTAFMPGVPPLVGQVSVLPVGMQLGYMHGNSITVANAGDGAFNVTLKSDDMYNIGLSMGLATGPLAYAGVSSGVSLDKAQGIFLRFPDQKSCEAFLNEFMNPDSTVHESGRANRSWLQAEDVRLLSGSTVSASIGASFSAVSFSHRLIEEDEEGKAVTASFELFSAGFKASKEVSHSTTHNAHGATDTFRQVFTRAGAVSVMQVGVSEDLGEHSETVAEIVDVSMGRSADLAGTEVYSKAGASLSVALEYNIVTGNRGLMGDTSMVLDMPVMGQSLDKALELFHLTDVQRQTILSDPAIQSAWDGATPGSTVKLTFNLRGEALDKARGLAISARTAEGAERQALQDQYNTLLKQSDSYAPARLTISSSEKQDVSDGLSSLLTYVPLFTRQASFAGLSSVSFDISERMAAAA